ncbi:hypothetical protein E3N88_00512 [Mikania micrantha]|uniref:ATPase AAA-type core domain-containing protein n=1 Tax=Mikania micrantha TaxID=192012 RepID=A0A5N6Q003_9ASTR|nr:hypothetical protein E3N88_00512 [Mikania micrantha]
MDNLLAANGVTLENEYNNDDNIQVLESMTFHSLDSSNAKKYKRKKKRKLEDDNEAVNSMLITSIDNVANAIVTDMYESIQRYDGFKYLSKFKRGGKTSLLFQLALNSVVDNTDKSVVFICNRRKLDNKPPFLSKGIDPSSSVLDRIQMKYVDDEDGINKFFAAFHMHDVFPVLVIIDDLGEFFDEK